MFLSKVYIPWSQAGNVYQFHQVLWRLFPGHEKDDRSFLFRVEQQQKGTGTKILMQSIQQPDENTNSPHLLAQRSYDINLCVGQKLHFRLRANPIKTIKDDRKVTIVKKSKIFAKTVRVPLLHEEEQRAWLERKFGNWAKLETLSIQPEPVLYFRKQKENSSGKIQPVLFGGILAIVDVHNFLNQLQKGIGPAKAFGCGLLSIAKA